MKTRLELAHEWVMKIIEGNVRAADASDLLQRAWQYADAMQAEADKREKQNKDEFYANLADPMKNVREQEWQPDWSQAPDGVKSWHMDADGRCYFVLDGCGTLFESSGKFLIEAWAKRIESPSFGYTGNWRDSLRKRPFENTLEGRYPQYEVGRNYSPDAWVIYNGELRLAVSISEGK